MLVANKVGLLKLYLLEKAALMRVNRNSKVSVFLDLVNTQLPICLNFSLHLWLPQGTVFTDEGFWQWS